MVYRITFISDDVENYRRVFEADAQASFLELHKAILEANGYTDDQMTSFFMCNDNWEKEQEVTLVEMESNFEYDNLVMESTYLEDLMIDEGQKLIYVFDPMQDRCLLGKLTAILPSENRDGVVCVESKGKAPKQIVEIDLSQNLSTSPSIDLDADMFGGSEYDPEELDQEGFGDMNFDDSSLF